MKKIFTLIAMALVAFDASAQTVIYSWESPEGTPVQSGGTIAYVNGDGDRLNYLNAGYYTICLNGKKGNMGDATPSANAGKMVITLDQELAADDVIAITAFLNKNESKEANAYIFFKDGVEAESPTFADAENIGEGMNGAIGTKSVRFLVEINLVEISLAVSMQTHGISLKQDGLLATLRLIQLLTG